MLSCDREESIQMPSRTSGGRRRTMEPFAVSPVDCVSTNSTPESCLPGNSYGLKPLWLLARWVVVSSYHTMQVAIYNCELL